MPIKITIVAHRDEVVGSLCYILREAAINEEFCSSFIQVFFLFIYLVVFLKLIFTQSNFAYIGISYLLMILLVKRNNLAIFSGIDSCGEMCFLK